MSRMIERIAEAIIDVMGPCDTLAPSEEIAKAVIAAMREPTDAMVGAGVKLLITEGDDCGAEMVWQAMIDAA